MGSKVIVNGKGNQITIVDKAILRKVKQLDFMVIFLLVMMLLTRFLTVGYISYMSRTTKADIDNIIRIVEANPLAAWILRLDRIGIILTVLVVPACLLGSYMVLRKWALENKMHIIHLEYLVMIFLYIAILNLCNDLGVFLGKMLQ